MKKDFYTVDHKILIDKLFEYGITEKEREWFKSYLSGRKQFCSVNAQRSKTEELCVAFLRDHASAPSFSLCTSMTLRVVWTSQKQTCMPMIRTQQFHLMT